MAGNAINYYMEQSDGDNVYSISETIKRTGNQFKNIVYEYEVQLWLRKRYDNDWLKINESKIQ